MTEILIDKPEGNAIPIHALRKRDLEGFLEKRRPSLRSQAALREFKANPGQVCAAVRGDGGVDRVLFGLGDEERPDPMLLRALPSQLGAGDYRIATAPHGLAAGLQAAVAWGLAATPSTAIGLGPARSGRGSPSAAAPISPRRTGLSTPARWPAT